jgi:Uracil DNA glycosylase superfamily
MTDFTPLHRSLVRGPRLPAGVGPVFNPYRDEDPALDRPGAARLRRANLAAYLERVGRPRLVLLGEALGYRGGRFSGIAFTGERQLAGPAGVRLPWAAAPESSKAPFQATSRNPALWLEPSGTVVWGALGGRAAGVLLWNTFPWHPPAPRGPLSNRTPERSLVAANRGVLEQLLAAVGAVPVLAVGRTAQAALADLGVAAPALRHPAHGGAGLFRSQVAGFLARL